MKSIQEFLSELANLDIRLYLDGERLRCNALQGLLTPELLIGAKLGDLLCHWLLVVRHLES